MFLTKFKRKLLSRPKLVRVIVGVLFISFILVLGSLVFSQIAPGVFKFSKKVILNQDSWALTSDNNRTNILVLGIGGSQHEGPNLTDTIIVISVVTKFDKDSLLVPPISIISIPRDIYLESLQAKINTAYSLGLEKNVGLALVKQSISEVTGLPIHYAIVVDFSVFEKIIDTLGGVDINVPNTLDDYSYPIEGQEENSCGFTPDEIAIKTFYIIDDASAVQAFPCRYEHLHFDPGLQHMDGKTALKFVRSRHAEDDEGSDFARSRRQQLVIKAVKDKIFSTQNLLNLSQGLIIYNEIKNHITSDVDLSHPKELFDLAMKYQNVQFKGISIDLNLLYNPPEDYRGWILIPQSGSWDEVHKYIKEAISN